MSISRGLLGEPKVRGLGLGLAAAFAFCDAACWAGVGKLAWKGVKSEVCLIRGCRLRALKSKGWDGRLLLPSLSLMLQLDLVGVVVAL